MRSSVLFASKWTHGALDSAAMTISTIEGGLAAGCHVCALPLSLLSDHQGSSKIGCLELPQLGFVHGQFCQKSLD